MLRSVAESLRLYLAGDLTHDQVREVAWEVIARADELVPSEKFTANEERALWHALWTIQHVADGEHWMRGITQRELQKALQYLDDPRSLPADIQARRP